VPADTRVARVVTLTTLVSALWLSVWFLRSGLQNRTDKKVPIKETAAAQAHPFFYKW